MCEMCAVNAPVLQEYEYGGEPPATFEVIAPLFPPYIEMLNPPPYVGD